MTDNGTAYRSTVHAIACRALGLRHLRTRPYRPRTNGKAERFIRTLLGGRAYGALYGTSRERTDALDGWRPTTPTLAQQAPWPAEHACEVLHQRAARRPRRASFATVTSRCGLPSSSIRFVAGPDRTTSRASRRAA